MRKDKKTEALDRMTELPNNSGGVAMCAGWMSISCGTRYVNLVIKSSELVRVGVN